MILVILFAISLSSCSQKHDSNTLPDTLPNYGEMGAAEDAGRAQ